MPTRLLTAVLANPHLPRLDAAESGDADPSRSTPGEAPVVLLALRNRIDRLEPGDTPGVVDG